MNRAMCTWCEEGQHHMCDGSMLADYDTSGEQREACGCASYGWGARDVEPNTRWGMKIHIFGGNDAFAWCENEQGAVELVEKAKLEYPNIAAAFSVVSEPA